MVTLDWDTERTDGVTLVRVYVAAERARRVRVANRLDGPVWPPRRRGQPAAGWDGDTFEGVAAPDDRLVAGYATPAPPADPPVEVVGDEPVDPADETADETADGSAGGVDVPEVETTPAGVVRSLGDPVVPRDAVPVPDPAAVSSNGHLASGHAGATVDGAGRNVATLFDDSDPPAADSDPPAAGGETSDTGPTDDRPTAGTPDDRRRTPQTDPTDRPPVVPGAVRTWLADVERRVAEVEQYDETVRGSPLDAAVAVDRRALTRVARWAEALSGRLADADPPEAASNGTRRTDAGAR